MENNIVKCELCQLKMKTRINGSHLKRVHNITLEQYISQFPNATIGKRIPNIISYTCYICNKNIRGSQSLSRHLNVSHHIFIEDYYTKYYLNDTKPYCKCGCGKFVNFNNMECGFDDYIIRHAPIWNIGLTKANDERVNHMYDNRKTWNKGLTKDTNAAVKQIASAIKTSWNTQNLTRRSLSYKTSMMEKYGVTNGFQLASIKEKSKQTMLRKYGVENPQFSNEIQYKWKYYTLPSGTKIKYQGYENWALDHFLTKMNEADIITDRKLIPKIKYIDFDGTIRRYCPDIWIPKDNLLVEVKSNWTYNIHKENIQHKQKGAINSGYNFKLFVFNDNGTINTSIQ